MGIVDLGKQYLSNVRIIHLLTGEDEKVIKNYCNSKKAIFASPTVLVQLSAGLAHAAEMGTRMPWLPPLPVAKAEPVQADKPTTGKFCPHCGKEL